MRRRDALDVLGGLALAGVAGCATTAPIVLPARGSLAKPTAFGVQIYQSDDIAKTLGLLTACGATYVRVSVQVDPSYLDALVAAATAQGLRVILISAYAAQPVNIAQYASSAAQLHQRYAAANPVWEIWNEPNLAQYWGAPPNVLAYLPLLAATASALRAAGATDVWSGGTSGVDLSWIYNLAARGAFNAANGCAVHSYKPPGFARTEYQQAVGMMPPGVLVHTTETCVASSSDQSDFFNQMWYIHRSLNLPTMVWCEFRDGTAGGQPPYSEAYGLVSGDYTLKPVYRIAQRTITAYP